MRKIKVIGLDGAAPYLFEWAKNRNLKNIGRLINNGVHGELRSTIPPNTFPAWASFVTGKNPGKHGCFGYIKPDGNLQYFDATKEDVFWKYLNRSVGIYNLPMTYPPFRINGFIIPGDIGAKPDGYDITFPTDLKSKLEEIDKRFVKRPFPIDMNKEAQVESLNLTLDREIARVKWLINNFPKLDIFMSYFNHTDRVQHFFWKYMDKSHPDYDQKESKKFGKVIPDYFERIDEEYVSLFLEEAANANIFIVSDHGFGEVYRRFNTNVWLKKMGLLHPVGKSFLRKAGITRQTVGKMLDRYGLRSLRTQIPEKVKQAFPNEYSIIDLIDMNKTKAFSTTRAYGWGYININDLQNFEKLRDNIIKKLKDINDPETCERVIDHAYKKEEIYSGKYLDKAPPIVLITNNLKYEVSASIEEDRIVAKGGQIRSGAHRMNGILIASGPDIKEGLRVERAQILDIAPTILHLSGEPIPEDMDGKVLKEIFKENSEPAKRAVEYRKMDEKEIIMERIEKLKALKRI